MANYTFEEYEELRPELLKQQEDSGKSHDIFAVSFSDDMDYPICVRSIYDEEVWLV